MKKLSGRQVAIVGTICLFLGALLLAVEYFAPQNLQTVKNGLSL